MRRHLFCAALLLGPWLNLGAAPADEESVSVRLLIRDASRALQAGNAALFLSKFDARSMAEFDNLRIHLQALTAQRRIASSVENGPVQRDGDDLVVEVDWLLQLTPLLDPGPVEKRRDNLSLRLAKHKGKWKIVELRPLEFFRSL